MKRISSSLKTQLARLKKRYPPSTKLIDSELEQYKKEAGLAAEDEFYFFLKHRIEQQRLAQPSKSAHRSKRATKRRSASPKRRTKR